MRVDAAVLGYYNMLRVQGWIGNLALVVERGLFGEAAPDGEIAIRVGEQLERLAEVMLPLLDRANRMMVATGKGPTDQIASISCYMKWKEMA